LQWKQEKIERRRRDEEERKERLILHAERLRQRKNVFRKNNELPMRK